MSSSNSFNSIAFNVVGAAILLVVVGYMGVSYVTTPAVQRCTTRYPSGQLFALSTAEGRAMSPVELQGRTGNREWGLLKNAKVLPAAKGGGTAVLEVSLATTENEDLVNQNGVGFTWSVPAANKSSSACLSYSVLLPKGFAFNEAGYLPGLYGANDIDQIDVLKPEEGFATRMAWAEAGDLGVDVRVPSAGGHFEGARSKTLWETGRWTKVEQEVKLNTPGKEDGILRIWIDGALTINRQGIVFRMTPETGINGVVADIGYARTLSDVVEVGVSPFIVQWQ
jgi:hypothetical protein